MNKIVVANWKMYLTLRESFALAKKVTRYTLHVTRYTVVLCPSFIALPEVGKIVSGTKIKLGAQDVEPEKRGAYTGEGGLDDLTALHVQYVLVGHSERRRLFKETDTIINKKLRAVLKTGMRPILCVGEPTRPSAPTTPNPSSGRRGNDRGQEAAKKYVANQVRSGLKGVSSRDLKRVIIAYEPVWAIGSDRADTPEDASEMHRWIRKVIHGGKASGAPEALPHVLYGGSVDAKNASSFIKARGIDGLLVGRASTSATAFSRILNNL